MFQKHSKINSLNCSVITKKFQSIYNLNFFFIGPLGFLSVKCDNNTVLNNSYKKN